MFDRCEWHESGTKLTLAKYFDPWRLTRGKSPEEMYGHYLVRLDSVKAEGGAGGCKLRFANRPRPALIRAMSPTGYDLRQWDVIARGMTP